MGPHRRLFQRQASCHMHQNQSQSLFCIGEPTGALDKAMPPRPFIEILW